MLATATAPVAPALFEIDECGTVLAPAYSETDRIADRELCQHYFGSWAKTAFSMNAAEAGHPTITFAQFQAAADRLAENAQG